MGCLNQTWEIVAEQPFLVRISPDGALLVSELPDDRCFSLDIESRENLELCLPMFNRGLENASSVGPSGILGIALKIDGFNICVENASHFMDQQPIQFSKPGGPVRGVGTILMVNAIANILIMESLPEGVVDGDLLMVRGAPILGEG